MTVDYDLVVAGGGPSGSAAAVAAANRGLSVLLLEQGGHLRPKTCGGLLPPTTSELVADLFGEAIPDSVKSDPGSVGVFYVPPSGEGQGGRLKNYRLLSVERPQFDEWLRSRAEDSQAEVAYDSTLIRYRGSNPICVEFNRGYMRESAKTRYLIGADGVNSLVRSALGEPRRFLPIRQESWSYDGELDDFVVYFDGRLADSYGYAIPKTGRVEVGIGPLSGNPPTEGSMVRLRSYLEEDMGLALQKIISKQSWAIPYNCVYMGSGCVLLVGDAAGFCNPFSGEGIRLGIESGESAGKSVVECMQSGISAYELYATETEQLRSLVEYSYKVFHGFTDSDREKFVKDELKRVAT